MLISKDDNKRKLTALAGVMLSAGSLMALSSSKANADTVQKAKIEMQSSSAKNTIVTPAQNSLYQQNQNKSDSIKADKARAKAVERQKQQAQKQNQQNQSQQNVDNQPNVDDSNNAGSNNDNNSQQNNNQQQNTQNQQQNNSQQNNTAENQNTGVAQGDNAVKAFDQASQDAVNQQEQNSINQSHQDLNQQAKDRQAHYQQLLQKVASAKATLQANSNSDDNKSNNDNGGNNDNSKNQTPTGSGSVYDQFIQAGGTPDMWKYIVMPESGGNPNAVNQYGYRGLGQTKESWGTGSVAEQTKGMINYANSRYGSIENAVHFRQTHNWW